MLRTIIKTADGSHSLFVKELNEHYHSIHGAIQESKHVFIEAGLNPLLSDLIDPNTQAPLQILEIGLGTGLNALLTCIEAEKTRQNIFYSAIEAYPVTSDLVDQLNYPALLEAQKYLSVFNAIHTAEWEKAIPLSGQFILYKINNTIQETVLEKKFNLIYFDAFGPAVQPEMWTEEVFTKLYEAAEVGGILVTYCAKGEVKRTLQKVGFTVESLKGPPGKREMIRARKMYLSSNK